VIAVFVSAIQEWSRDGGEREALRGAIGRSADRATDILQS